MSPHPARWKLPPAAAPSSCCNISKMKRAAHPGGSSAACRRGRCVTDCTGLITSFGPLDRSLALLCVSSSAGSARGQFGNAWSAIFGRPLGMNYCMIATGNHGYYDSPRDAPLPIRYCGTNFNLFRSNTTIVHSAFCILHSGHLPDKHQFTNKKTSLSGRETDTHSRADTERGASRSESK